MKEKINLDKRLVTAVLYVVTGLLFIIFRSGVLNWVMTAIGILFIVQAVFSAVAKNWTSAAIYGVIGLVTILGGWLFLSVVLIVFGVLLVISGVTAFIPEFKAKNYRGLISPSVTVLIGVLLIISHWAMVDWFFIVFGAIFVINGVLEFAEYLKTKPEEKKETEEANKPE